MCKNNKQMYECQLKIQYFWILISSTCWLIFKKLPPKKEGYYITMKSTVWIIVSLFICTSGAQNLCSNEIGPRCQCKYIADRLEIMCKEKALTNVPVGIQPDVFILDFSKNVLTTIESQTFNGLTKLNTLYLQQNSIQSLAKGAFEKLYNLTILNLQHNKLAEIKTNAFVYLPNLMTLNLSYNAIATIERDLLIRLPRLMEISFTDNQLVCDCEAGAFLRLLNAKTTSRDFEVQSGSCVGTKLKLTDMKDDQFGMCTGDTFRQISCLYCKNATSTENCLQQNRSTTCQFLMNETAVCYEELRFTNYSVGINKDCQDYSQCLQIEKNNGDNCYNHTGSELCRFCCVGALCNRNALRDRMHTATFLGTIHLDANHSQIREDSRDEFGTAIESYINGNLTGPISQYGTFHSDVIRFRGKRVIIDVLIILTSRSKYPANDTLVYIRRTIGKIHDLIGFSLEQFDVILLDQKCSSEITRTDMGVFEWPSVDIGLTATVICPNSSAHMARRFCTMHNGSTAAWELPDYSRCPRHRSLTQSLDDLSKVNVTSDNVDTIQTDLLVLTKESPKFSSADVSLSVDVIENVLNEQSVLSNETMVDKMVESMSNLLDSPDDAISINTNKSSERFVNSVEYLANNIKISNNTFSVVHHNLALLVQQADSNTFSGITVNTKVEAGVSLTDEKIIIKDGEDLSELESGVVVPASLLNKTQKSSAKFSFAIYGNTRMFMGVKDTELARSKANHPNQVNGPVISTTLQNTNVNNLQHPVTFRFKHFKKISDNPQCVFVVNSGSSELVWSSKGCNVKHHVPDSQTDCECNHLTSFALLMDIYQSGDTLSKTNRLALTYISYIGCGVSLLGLVITLITYCMFRHLRTSNPSKILINLCISLAMTNIIFLVGMQEYTLDNDIVCKIVAASLHYVLLAALSWMLVEAFYMYLALIKVFNTYFSHFLLKCCLFGWGVPLIVVGVTLGIGSTNNYGQQKGGICWLSPVPFYTAFLAPVGIILILNFIVFSFVVQIIVKGTGTKIAKTDSNKTSVSQRLKGAIGIIVLLGLTWVFAVFAIGDGGIIFQYLFTVFNSLQGLFIFVFNCLLKTDAQTAWKKKYSGTQSKYSDPSISKNKRDIQSRDTRSDFNTSDEMDSKNGFTDIKKKKANNYSDVRGKSKEIRFPSYSEEYT